MAAWLRTAAMLLVSAIWLVLFVRLTSWRICVRVGGDESGTVVTTRSRDHLDWRARPLARLRPMAEPAWQRLCELQATGEPDSAASQAAHFVSVSVCLYLLASSAG